MPRSWRNLVFGILVVVFVSFCAESFGAQNEAGQANTNGGFLVAGVVVSARTGEPLVQARVTLVSVKDRREALSVITQEDGRFAFKGLSAGKYSLEGARRGYIPAAYEQHEQFSTAIVTGKEFDTQNLTLRLVPMASLTGAVIDEYGEGVRDAQVRLYLESHRGGTTRVTTASATGTDDRGTFEFAPLEPGKYFVSVNARPWYAMSAPPSGGREANPAANVDASIDVAYPTTFFGGSTESDGAQAITVKGGDHAEIEIHLRPVQALHLTFHVADNGQHGFQPPIFQKQVFGSLEYVPMENSQSSSSPGVFEISGIPAGRYSVRMPGNGSEETEQVNEIELSQAGQDLNELKGELVGRVKLTVTMADAHEPPKQMNIGLENEQNKIVAVSQLNEKGEAKFEGLAAGEYGIRVFAPGKAYSVTRMASESAQVSGHEFNLKSGESQEWSVSLTEGNTRIEGFVKRGGKAASGIMVVLVPNGPKAHQDLFRRDQSDLDGSFVLPGVIPGSYTLVAIEDAWGFDWSKPALLAHYAEHGQALTIGELMQGAFHLVDPLEVQPR